MKIMGMTTDRPSHRSLGSSRSYSILPSFTILYYLHHPQYPHPVYHHSTIHLQTKDQPTNHLHLFLYQSCSGPLMPILPGGIVPHLRLCPHISPVVQSYHFRYGALPPTHWPVACPSQPLVWHLTLPGLGATVFLSRYADFILYSLFHQFMQCY